MAPPTRSALVLPAVALLVLLLGAGCSGAGGRPARAADPAAPTARSAPAPSASVVPAREPRAATVLRAWDARRARAWAAGSVRSLRDLYLPTSGAGRSDVRRLRAYLHRGLVVHGMRTQLLGLRVVAATPGELRVVVTDRLASAVAAQQGGGGPGTRLPRGAAATRTVTLVRAGGVWRVGAVLSAPAPR